MAGLERACLSRLQNRLEPWGYGLELRNPLEPWGYGLGLRNRLEPWGYGRPRSTLLQLRAA